MPWNISTNDWKTPVFTVGLTACFQSLWRSRIMLTMVINFLSLMRNGLLVPWFFMVMLLMSSWMRLKTCLWQSIVALISGTFLSTVGTEVDSVALGSFSETSNTSSIGLKIFIFPLSALYFWCLVLAVNYILDYLVISTTSVSWLMLLLWVSSEVLDWRAAEVLRPLLIISTGLKP